MLSRARLDLLFGQTFGGSKKELRIRQWFATVPGGGRWAGYDGERVKSDLDAVNLDGACAAISHNRDEPRQFVGCEHEPGYNVIIPLGQQ